MLEAGALLGKYRLERIVGAGGMGVVWAAVDPDLDRTVALKVLRVAGDDPLLRSRLLREARAMARLKHGNVLTVYEVGTHKNRDYIAMELIEGASLDVWLAGKPPRPQIVAALMAAGRGLAAAHAAGIIHRDFKPHNVLRDQDGRVLVTDFGLARGQIESPEDAALEQLDPSTFLPPGAAGEAETGVGTGGKPRRALDSVLDSPLTQTGVLIGTPAYMAPEQFIGATPDPRTDQFAFCVAAWEALTGARPFRGGSLDELKQAAGRGVGEVTADLPKAVRAVLQRGLEPDPAKRWPDMAATLAALEQAFWPPSKRNAWVAALVVAALLVLGVGVGMIVRVAFREGDGGGSGSAEKAIAEAEQASERRKDRRVVVKEGKDGATLVIPMPKLGDHIEVPMPPMPPVPPAAPEAPLGSERGEAKYEAAMEAAEEARAFAEELKHAAAERRVATQQERRRWKGCGAGEAAKTFESAWSPEQRRELLNAPAKDAGAGAASAAGSEGGALSTGAAKIGAVAMLDRVRQEWLRAYARACAAESREEFEQRRECLMELRDDVRNTVRALRKAGEISEMDFASVAAVVASTAMCVGDDEPTTKQ